MNSFSTRFGISSLAAVTLLASLALGAQAADIPKMRGAIKFSPASLATSSSSITGSVSGTLTGSFWFSVPTSDSPKTTFEGTGVCTCHSGKARGIVVLAIRGSVPGNRAFRGPAEYTYRIVRGTGNFEGVTGSGKIVIKTREGKLFISYSGVWTYRAPHGDRRTTVRATDYHFGDRGYRLRL